MRSLYFAIGAIWMGTDFSGLIFEGNNGIFTEDVCVKMIGEALSTHPLLTVHFLRDFIRAVLSEG